MYVFCRVKAGAHGPLRRSKIPWFWTSIRQPLPYRITEGLPVIRAQSRGDGADIHCVPNFAYPLNAGGFTQPMMHERHPTVFLKD
jgi:hypothetical protein